MRFYRRIVSYLIAVFVPASLGILNDSPVFAAEGSLQGDTRRVSSRSTGTPYGFTMNMGQWDERVLYRTRSGGATIWITRDGLVYQFTRRLVRDADPSGASSRSTSTTGPTAISAARFGDIDHRADSLEQLVVTAFFVGANEVPRAQGQEELRHKTNYFLGNDPAKWRTNVSSHAAVVLEEVYPGVDVSFGTNETGQLTCEWLAAPGASMAAIRVEYADVFGNALNTEQSDLVVTAWGHSLPRMTAQIAGPIEIAPRVVPQAGTARFASGVSGASSSVPPVELMYSTYLGTGSGDIGKGIAVDKRSRAHVAGITTGALFPLENPYQAVKGVAEDIFISTFDSAGNTLLQSTFLGGDNADMDPDIAVDDSGEAFVSGSTLSTDFPTTIGAYNEGPNGGYDVFVTRLSRAGDTLRYSTYIGGSVHDVGNGIDIDPFGNAYVTGRANSANYPTVSPEYDASHNGDRDVFVSKLSSDGSTLEASTFIGGSDQDVGYGIAVAAGGDVFVAGFTWSAGFPFTTTIVSGMGFVARLPNDLSGLDYNTAVSNFEVGDIAVDNAGCAYITGITHIGSNPGFPTTPGAFMTSGFGGEDALAMKLTSDGSALVYSTYLSGSGGDYGASIAVDRRGHAFVAGTTYSTSFPTLHEYQADLLDNDMFVTCLNPEGTGLRYSTYLGGNTLGPQDWALGIDVDHTGKAYVTGYTYSPDFPTVNAFDNTLGLDLLHDATVTKFSCVFDDDLDGICGGVDNCVFTPNTDQADVNSNGIGDACEVPHAWTCDAYCPIDLVVIDPNGDSIGIGFNTIGLGSSCDTTQDINSADLSGPDGELDDRITIPTPVVGDYTIRVVREAGASDNDRFTVSIRIDGNQQLVPDDYRDATVSSLGNTISDTYVWVAATTLTGDINADGVHNSADIILLVNYVFKGGPPPTPLNAGDIDCLGTITSSDIIQMVNFIFKSGLAPCSGSAG